LGRVVEEQRRVIESFKMYELRNPNLRRMTHHPLQRQDEGGVEERKTVNGVLISI